MIASFCNASVPPAGSQALLPLNYSPSQNTAVIGQRGKKAQLYPGNIKLQKIVKSELAAYAYAKTKTEKSYILLRVIDRMDSVNTTNDGHYPGITFVKHCSKTKRWFAVDRHAVRAAVAQVFRDQDSLSSKYRSSKVAKRADRLKEKIQGRWSSSMSVVSTESSASSEQLLEAFNGNVATSNAGIVDMMQPRICSSSSNVQAIHTNLSVDLSLLLDDEPINWMYFPCASRPEPTTYIASHGSFDLSFDLCPPTDEFLDRSVFD